MRLALFVFFIILPIACLGHPNHIHMNSFQSGLIHPFTGWDHTFAMLAIGVLAYQKRHTWLWQLPLLFVLCVFLGGLIGTLHYPLPLIETGILFSLLFLGTCILYPKRIPESIIIALCPLFAICHGYAHGAEIPQSVLFEGYASGFILATAFLHLLGMGLSWIGTTLRNLHAMW